MYKHVYLRRVQFMYISIKSIKERKDKDSKKQQQKP